MVFSLSNFLIGINPFSKELHIVRFMSIIVIIFLLYYNSIQSTIITAFILPLSINKISYLKEIGQNTIYVDSDSESKMLCLFNINEISDFLN
jgi:hypothetical protein